MKSVWVLIGCLLAAGVVITLYMGLTQRHAQSHDDENIHGGTV